MTSKEIGEKIAELEKQNRNIDFEIDRLINDLKEYSVTFFKSQVKPIVHESVRKQSEITKSLGEDKLKCMKSEITDIEENSETIITDLFNERFSLFKGDYEKARENSYYSIVAWKEDFKSKLKNLIFNDVTSKIGSALLKYGYKCDFPYWNFDSKNDKCSYSITFDDRISAILQGLAQDMFIIMNNLDNLDKLTKEKEEQEAQELFDNI